MYLAGTAFLPGRAGSRANGNRDAVRYLPCDE